MKVDKDGNPINDDGTPVAPPEGYVLVKKEEHDRLTDVGKRLDHLELRLDQPQPAAAPTAPAGPSIETQTAQIDADIEKLDAKIDDLVMKIADGQKPADSLAKLNKQRADLVTKKSDLRWDAQFSILANQGMSTIAGLTDQVMSGQMPYLAVPAIKQEYDRFISNLHPSVRANPQQIKEVYNLAVGRHPEELYTFQVEQANRKAAQTSSQTPGAVPNPGREPGGKGKTGDKLPTFEEHFGSDAVAILRAKNQTPDDFARKLGYKDAADYVKFAVDQEGGHA